MSCTPQSSQVEGLYSYYEATTLGNGILEKGVRELMREEWDLLDAYSEWLSNAFDSLRGTPSALARLLVGTTSRGSVPLRPRLLLTYETLHSAPHRYPHRVVVIAFYPGGRLVTARLVQSRQRLKRCEFRFECLDLLA